MTSPLAGGIARSIGKAFSGIFFDATLTRSGVAFPCKGLIDKWGKYPGASSTTEPTFEVLILAASLTTEPAQGDVVALQGQSFTIFSGSKSKMAVSLDPAGAVWTVLAGAPGSTNQVGGAANTGAALAASLGRPYQVFRGSGSSPLVTAPITTTNALFTVGSTAGFSLTKSAGWDTVLYNGAFDETDVQVGDYLVGHGETYFVADLPYLLPPVCVLCNTTVALRRPRGADAVGATLTVGDIGYSGQDWSTTPGDTDGEDVLLTGIPASALFKSPISRTANGLPTDAHAPNAWEILLPQSAAPRGSVHVRDVIVDDLGARYQVIAPEWTALGYKVRAEEEERSS